MGETEDLRHDLELGLQRDGIAVEIEILLEGDVVVSAPGHDVVLVEARVVLGHDVLLDERQVDVPARDDLAGFVLVLDSLCFCEVEGYLHFLLFDCDPQSVLSLLVLHKGPIFGQLLHFGGLPQVAVTEVCFSGARAAHHKHRHQTVDIY